jgi:hypothetical protein
VYSSQCVLNLPPNGKLSKELFSGKALSFAVKRTRQLTSDCLGLLSSADEISSPGAAVQTPLPSFFVGKGERAAPSL